MAEIRYLSVLDVEALHVFIMEKTGDAPFTGDPLSGLSGKSRLVFGHPMVEVPVGVTSPTDDG